jgi:hypothetical protein
MMTVPVTLLRPDEPLAELRGGKSVVGIGIAGQGWRHRRAELWAGTGLFGVGKKDIREPRGLQIKGDQLFR